MQGRKKGCTLDISIERNKIKKKPYTFVYLAHDLAFLIVIDNKNLVDLGQDFSLVYEEIHIQYS